MESQPKKIKLEESPSEQKIMKPYELSHITKEAIDYYALEKMTCIQRHRLVVLGMHKSGKTSIINRLLSKNLNQAVSIPLGSLKMDIKRNLWEFNLSPEQPIEMDVWEVGYEYMLSYPISELFIEDGHTLCIVVNDFSENTSNISRTMEIFIDLFTKRNRKIPPFILVGTRKNNTKTEDHMKKEITEMMKIITDTHPDISINDDYISVDCEEEGAVGSGFLSLRDRIMSELSRHEHIQQGVSIPVSWIACQKTVQDYTEMVSCRTSLYQPPEGKKMPPFSGYIKNYRAVPIFSCNDFMKNFIFPHITGDNSDQRSQAVLEYLEIGHYIKQAGGNVVLNVPWLIREFGWFRYIVSYEEAATSRNIDYTMENFKTMWCHLDEKIVEMTIMPLFFSYGYT